ncbi:hypothetical protein KXC42_23230 [Rhodococcus sp. LW-XY12]|nr:hypothetical protein [Rhodococcus sp. LW-XY12]QXU53602.1 hypothetical protein KXC42_23230 [Rhodococcus sp. LW-XY12]
MGYSRVGDEASTFAAAKNGMAAVSAEGDVRLVDAECPAAAESAFGSEYVTECGESA